MDIRISVILEIDTKTDDLFFSFLPIVPSIDLSLLFYVLKDTWIKQQQLVSFTCRPRTFYNRVHAPILPTDRMHRYLYVHVPLSSIVLSPGIDGVYSPCRNSGTPSFDSFKPPVASTCTAQDVQNVMSRAFKRAS